MRLVTMVSLAAMALAQAPSEVVPPRLMSHPEPEYPEEARRAGVVHAEVRLSFVVDENGIPQDFQVVQGAGFGLDEKAIQAVSAWRFAPSTAQGIPIVSGRNSVDTSFALDYKETWHNAARLNFALPPGATRPELLTGKMPANPMEPREENLRIALSVGEDGKTQDIFVIDTTSAQWAEDAVRAMKDWRFRPANLDGRSVVAEGVFELARHTSSTGATPSSIALDLFLPAPKLMSPADGAVFDSGDPRRTTCQWEPSAGAASYILEWDLGFANGSWLVDISKRPAGEVDVRGTQYNFDFIGSRPVRWRVVPVNAKGQRGNASESRVFRYLH